MSRVSFQGMRGAYSEAAARSFFGDAVQTMPCQTFSEALRLAETGESECAVLPVENLIEGSVGESYDLLLSTKLLTAGEIYHHIQHCLIGTGKAGTGDNRPLAPTGSGPVQEVHRAARSAAGTIL